jgi:Uma2 family endonuclease
MATIEQSAMTAEQLLAAPGLGRCELIQGELIKMSPVGFEHGSIVTNVSLALGGFVKQHGLGRVAGSETGFRISRDPDTVRAPDVAFVRAQRVPPEPVRGYFEGAPDLAVEILSPHDRATDVLDKVHQWLRAGCQVVWVVDPEKRTVTVYEAPDRAMMLARGDELSGGELLPGLRLPVVEVFAP